MSNPTSRMHAFIEHLPVDISTRRNLKEILRQPLQHLADFEDRLVTLFPQLNQGKVDDPFKPSSPQGRQTPPQVTFTVTQKASLPGLSFVNITVPQVQIPGSDVLFALLAQRGANAPLAGMVHRIQSASSGQFNEGSSVQTYEPATNSFLTLPDTNSHWRIQSSFDTKNFNDFTAPRMALLIA